MGIKFSKLHYSKRNSTSKVESSFPNIIIPEDIIAEILSRLSLDSLCRFACVSKQWRSLTSNIFVAKTRSPTVLLVSDSRAYSFSPHSIDQNRQQEVDVRSIHVPWKLSESGDNEFKILGSCNGLVLLHIDEDLFLWNPLTRLFQKVLASDQVCDDMSHYSVCSGLCYDSTGDEYKAVLGYANQTPNFNDGIVMVGSFRSKSWTMVLFPYIVPTWISGSIVNGHLHWFASNDDGEFFLSPHQIIYFNAQIDKFEELPMPEPRGEDGDLICGLGVLDGNLCMSRWDHPGYNESNVEVLVMKEYGVAKSWTILFVVSDGLTLQYPYDDLMPLGYTKNGEVLTRVSMWVEYIKYDTHVRAFNLKDNSHRRIPIPEDPKFFVIAHEDCLITPTDLVGKRMLSPMKK